MDRQITQDDRKEDDKTESNGTFWQRVSTNALVRFLLFAAVGWVLVQLINYFQYVIFVFAFAAILAILLNYPVQYLKRFLPRRFALGIVVLLSLAAIFFLALGVGVTIADQLQDIAAILTQTITSLQTPLNQVQAFLNQRNISLDLSPLQQQLQTFVFNGASWLVTYIPTLLGSYVTLIIVLVITFFMLIDEGNLWQFILRLVPQAQRDRFDRSVRRSFQGFIRGQLLISFLLGLATYIVFVIFSLPFALVLSMVVAVFDLIPGIGATLGVTLACVLVLLQSGWWVALQVLAICVILQQLQDNLLAPRIMQSTVRLHPLVVFFALLVGTQIAGLLGVFLAVPVAGAIVSFLQIEELQAA